MMLPCEKIIDGKRTGIYEFVDFKNEVFFIDIFKPSKRWNATYPLFHTRRGFFTTIQTLEGYEVALQDEGYASLDSVNVVNLSMVRGIDEGEGSISFDGEEKTSVAKIHYKTIREMLEED